MAAQVEWRSGLHRRNAWSPEQPSTSVDEPREDASEEEAEEPSDGAEERSPGPPARRLPYFRCNGFKAGAAVMPYDSVKGTLLDPFAAPGPGEDEAAVDTYDDLQGLPKDEPEAGQNAGKRRFRMFKELLDQSGKLLDQVQGRTKGYIAAFKAHQRIRQEHGNETPRVTDCVIPAAASRSTLYTDEQLRAATNGFAESHKLGQGAYGVVYRGDIHGTPVAIKRLFGTSLQQSGFTTELDVLTRIRHPNIVLLMGYCLDGEHPALVYEHLSGGNLAQRLACEGGRAPLSWMHRLRIATELASALLFLHSQGTPILHRDLKPENVMLDEAGRCKVVDVGTARMNDNSENITLFAAGTLGYIDPEIFTSARVTRSLDVYSFGLILFHLLTGITSVGAIHELREATDAAKLLDHHLDASAGDWDEETAEVMACLAYGCLNNSKSRPLMFDVHSLLSYCKELPPRHARGMES